MTGADGRDPGRGLWIGLAVGAPLMAYGARGAVVDAALTHPWELTRWVVGSALVHDLVLAPVVLAVGHAARRTTPATAWPAVRWALLTTGVLALVAWPLVRGYGRNPTVPSLLPRNYGAGLAVAVGVVWLLAATWALVALVRSPGRQVGGGDGPVPPSPESGG